MKITEVPAVPLVLTTTALLVACGGGEPAAPLTLQRAPAAAGTTIDLNVPLDGSGFFEFDEWPQACEILTDAAIQAVLPQTAKVERESEDQEINIIGAGDLPRRVTAVGAKCTYGLDLSAAGMGLDDQSPPELLVTVDHAGSPETVEQNFSGDVDDRIAVPDGECYVIATKAGVSCRKGQLAFTISSNFPHQGLDEDFIWIDHYTVDGTTTTFTNKDLDDDADVDEFTRAEVFRRDALEVELAKLVLSMY